MMKALLFFPMLLLVACSILQQDEPAQKQATLADLQPRAIEALQGSAKSYSLDDVEGLYKEALRYNKDPELDRQIKERLAGIAIAKSERDSYNNPENTAAFVPAIAAYETLLADYPDRPGNDRVLYQLAKAYELNGEPDKAIQTFKKLIVDYPQTIYFGEASFRIAENAFSAKQYASAEKAYLAVLSSPTGSDYYLNASYMLGWSQFKQARYDASLISFTDVLDHLIKSDQAMNSLKESDQELVNDTFRIMSIAFSYEGGAESIQTLTTSVGARQYQWLWYDKLGDYYLELERYSDAAAVFESYVENYTFANRAPYFSGRVIDAYLQGEFYTDVLSQKKIYVENYIYTADFWSNQREADVPEQVQQIVQAYLLELAAYEYVLAQESAEKLVELQQGDASDPDRAGLITAEESKRVAAFTSAAAYYQQYCDYYPLQVNRFEQCFMAAEALNNAGQYAVAAKRWQGIAYQYPNSEKAVEAAYAAIIAYQQLDGDSSQSLLSAQLRFADVFPQDSRAPRVLLNAVVTLYEQQQYEQLLPIANTLYQWGEGISEQERQQALLILANSYFLTEQYAQAEPYLRQLLASQEQNTAAWSDTRDKLSAAFFKQADLALAEGRTSDAISYYQTVINDTPNSSYRAAAQYNVANLLIEAGDYDQATAYLQDYRLRYPNDELTASIPAKLAQSYQDQGKWGLAAVELMLIADNSAAAPELRQQSLYAAAEMYQKDGDVEQARNAFREYANSYQEPRATVLEAKYQLTVLYQQMGDPEKRNFWLNKIIADDAAVRTERSRFLAAQASLDLANQSMSAFSAYSLKQPLKTSIRKKRNLLDDSLQQYQRTVDYGVANFATEATHRIGLLYAELADELLNAPPPAGMDELAREQFSLLMEEQAYPFEEKAIGIFEANAQRSHQGVYDDWVKNSFESLRTLLPARYNKPERGRGVADEIY